jgi:hypothetical protein
MQENN